MRYAPPHQGLNDSTPDQVYFKQAALGPNQSGSELNLSLRLFGWWGSFQTILLNRAEPHPLLENTQRAVCSL